MKNKRLLNKNIKGLDYRLEYKQIKYNKDIFNSLFEKYKFSRMEEEFYYCYGLESIFWLEIGEEGICDMKQQRVNENILRNIKNCRKYLYNGRKYGSNRLHIREDEEGCYVFIYLRDVLGVDYNIWFYN